MSKKLLKILIEEIIKETLQEGKELLVMDFDDTLVKTKGKIYVTKDSGEKKELTPAEYAAYQKKPGDKFDYSDFVNVTTPEAINWTQDILKNAIEKNGIDSVLILTARGRAAEPEIRAYLASQEINPNIPIEMLGDSDPEKKAQFLKMLAMLGYSEIKFYDDSEKNIKAARETANKLLDKAKIDPIHVKHQ